MKRAIVALTALITIPLIAGLYGALHDQLSCSVSPEYFTLWKYKQFGFEPEQFGGHRPTIAVIGFLATWWVGAVAALFIVPLGFMFNEASTMKKEIIRGVVIMLSVALVFGLTALVVGLLTMKAPSPLIQQWAVNMNIVGSMHSFSYAGAVIGLCAAITVMVWRKQQSRTRVRTFHFGQP